MNQCNDTTQQPNTLETLKNGQIDTSTKVTLLDMVKGILLAVLIIALLLFITTLQQAHPKNSLLLVAGMGQNNATTKLTAAKPSRQSLAIFVPKINPTTNRTIATGTKTRHIFSLSHHEEVISYGGFIDLIKDLYGNKSSRLLTVVTSRHLLIGGQKITKLTGVANHG